MKRLDFMNVVYVVLKRCMDVVTDDVTDDVDDVTKRRYYCIGSERLGQAVHRRPRRADGGRCQPGQPRRLHAQLNMTSRKRGQKLDVLKPEDEIADGARACEVKLECFHGLGAHTQ